MFYSFGYSVAFIAVAGLRADNRSRPLSIKPCAVVDIAVIAF